MFCWFPAAQRRMSRATVTSPYSSQATHRAITSAAYKLKQTFALIVLLGPFIPFLFCFLLSCLMFSFEGLVHLATTVPVHRGCVLGIHSGAAWIWDTVLCDTPIPASLCFPGYCPWDSFPEIHCSKQNGSDICSFYLPSLHLFLQSSVFSSDIICLSFHAEYGREISLFLT